MAWKSVYFFASIDNPIQWTTDGYVYTRNHNTKSEYGNDECS